MVLFSKYEFLKTTIVKTKNDDDDDDIYTCI